HHRLGGPRGLWTLVWTPTPVNAPALSRFGDEEPAFSGCPLPPPAILRCGGQPARTNTVDDVRRRQWRALPQRSRRSKEGVAQSERLRRLHPGLWTDRAI